MERATALTLQLTEMELLSLNGMSGTMRSEKPTWKVAMTFLVIIAVVLEKLRLLTKRPLKRKIQKISADGKSLKKRSLNIGKWLTQRPVGSIGCCTALITKAAFVL